MPRNITKTQSRNAQLHALWATLPDAEFERLGCTRAQLIALQDGLSGYVVLPGMADYDTDRKLFNPVFDSYPVAIVYCESDLDVAQVLQFAQATPIGFQVRSGGHCTAGFSSGRGILLDVFWLEASQRAAAQQFLEGWIALVDPLSNGLAYQNYPRLGEPHYAQAYWGDAQAGLYAVKCKYDKTMAFMFAQQVCPLMPPFAGVGPRIILPDFLQAALDQPIAYDTLAAA